MVRSVLAALVLLSTAAAPGSTPPAQWVTHDLGTLGGTNSEAAAVNIHGMVVGWSGVRSTNGLRHAFLWQRGRMEDLGAVAGFPSSRALDVNDNGQVVGESYSTRSSRGFIWKSGHMTDLGTISGAGVYPAGITDKGTVVGVLDLTGTNGGAFRAFIWRQGHMTTLPALSGANVDVNDFNDRGQIVGYATTRSGATHAVIWQRGAVTRLPTLSGYPESQAVAINEQGDVVVGFSSRGSGGDQVRRACLWRNGRVVDLGNVPNTPDSPSVASEVGEDGSVYVIAEPVNGAWTTYRWQDGHYTNLNGWVTAVTRTGLIFGARGGHATVWENERPRWITVRRSDVSAASADGRFVAGQLRFAKNVRHAAVWIRQ